MSDYPRMLYRRREGAELIHGVPVETRIVTDWQEAEKARQQGWRRLPSDTAVIGAEPVVKRGPGRPRKNPIAPESEQA